MWRAEIPKASTNSSGLPECGMPVDREQLEFRRRGSGLGQRGEHRFADAAFRPVVFHRDEPSASGFDLFGERFAVDRLDAVKIDHANRNPLRFQLRRRLSALRAA